MKNFLLSLLAFISFFGNSFAQENEDILKDPNYIELENTRDVLSKKINDKILNNEITLDELKAIFQEGDKTKLYELYGFSQNDIVDYENKLSLLKANLIKNFPNLEVEIENARNCTECNKDINKALNNLDYLVNNKVQTKCKWVQFTACVLLATEFPPAYPVAAYLCYCSYCEGTVPDRLCL